MRTQSPDTSLEAENVQIALLRQAPPRRRLELVRGLCRATRRLAILGWRQHHPDRSSLHLRRFLAGQWLGAALAEEALAALERAPDEGDQALMDIDPLAVTLLVVQQLESQGVVYLLGGSMASSMLGVSRSTLDADILADLDQHHIDDFANALQPAFYVDAESIRDAVSRRDSFNVIHLQTMFKIDVFVARNRAFDRSQLAHRVRQLVATDPDRYIFTASPEDTVLAKLEWYRLGGGVSDRQWHDVLGVLKVQGEAIDQAYLRRWAHDLGLDGPLARALDDAGLR